jgi:thioredoxin 1
MMHLSDENFDKEISKSDKYILVDFFAVWCPPCSALSPILEKLEKEYKDKVVFAKIDVDKCPRTSQKFGVSPIPMVVLLKDKKQIDQFIGLKPEAEIKKWLSKHVK